MAAPQIVRLRREFTDWLGALRDERARKKIVQRLQRVRDGLIGDAASVGGRVSELRVDYGPGYRLYFTRRADIVIPAVRRRQIESGARYRAGAAVGRRTGDWR